MKKILFIILCNLKLYGQTCSVLFSYGANFNTTSFFNQSTVSNAHYFWNFGDGTGSNLKNPTHIFPETGNYLVTLFAKDTVSGCSNYYETWLNLIKNSTDPCQSSITDSLFQFSGSDNLKIVDKSSNCSGYGILCDGGSTQNFTYNNWIYLQGFPSYRMVCRAKYINANVVKRLAYKTSLYKYSSAKNYNPCSANFEFSVVSQNATGQRILFKAMNDKASSFQWNISGDTGYTTSTNDTVSKFFSFAYTDFQDVRFFIAETNGCKDTLFQNILVRQDTSTFTFVKESEYANSVDIFPNPASNILHISNGQYFEEESIIEITNILGKSVLIMRYQKEIDISLFASGCYFMKIQSKDRQFNSKFIKE